MADRHVSRSPSALAPSRAEHRRRRRLPGAAPAAAEGRARWDDSEPGATRLASGVAGIQRGHPAPPTGAGAHTRGRARDITRLHDGQPLTSTMLHAM